MDIVHLHLLLNHVPVIGAVFAALLLGVAVLRNSTELGKVALGFLALLGIVAVTVYLTGEPAEELVEGLPGVSKAIIERHEEAALAATIAMGALGVLALAAIVVFRGRTLPRWTSGAALIGSICVVGVMGYTANLGGQIRHTEIRPGGVAQATQLPGSEQLEDRERAERDDR